MREARALGGDAQVAADGEVEAAREGRTVHRRDQRQREAQQRVVEAIARLPEALGERGIPGGGAELREVEARREDVAGAGDDRAAERGIARQLRERLRDLVAQGDRERVLLLGPVERDA